MNEDFTEEEFEDGLPEGVEFAEPPEPVATKPKKMEQRAAPTRDPKLRKPSQQPVAPATETVEMERFTPFVTPRRVGVLDNETQEPLMEDKDSNMLLLGLVTKLLNDVDDIKKNL